MAYDALVAGARVIFWWGQSMMDLDSTPGDLWESILSTVKELDALGGILSWPEADVDVGGVPFLARESGGVVHLLAVNPSGEARDVVIDWKEPACAIWDRDREKDRSLLADRQTERSTVTLEPHGVLRWTARLCR